MPGPVSSTAAASAIAALLRQAVSGQARGGKPAAATEKARKDADRSSLQKRTGQTPLAGLIVRRAAELDPDASDYRSRLLRLVIEATLLHEWGGNLLNAPKFQSMVDQVVHDLEQANGLKQDVDMVLERLTKGNWPDA